MCSQSRGWRNVETWLPMGAGLPSLSWDAAGWKALGMAKRINSIVIQASAQLSVNIPRVPHTYPLTLGYTSIEVILRSPQKSIYHLVHILRPG